MTGVFVTEATGCSYFHPFTCGNRVVAPCPINCRRKQAFDVYYGPDDEDPVSTRAPIPDSSSADCVEAKEI